MSNYCEKHQSYHHDFCRYCRIEQLEAETKISQACIDASRRSMAEEATQIEQLEAVVAYAAKVINQHCGCLNGRYYTPENLETEWENSLTPEERSEYRGLR